jgi:spore germination protein YaaH
MKKNIIVSLIAVFLFFIVVLTILNRINDNFKEGIYLNGVMISDEESIILEKGDAFVRYSSIADKGILDSFYDTEDNIIYIYKDLGIYKIILEGKDNHIYRLNEGSVFININYLQDKFLETYEILKSEKSIFLESKYSIIVSENSLWLYSDDNAFKNRLIKINSNEKITFYERKGRWNLVRYGDYIGYIKNYGNTTIFSRNFEKEMYNPNNKKIVMAWDFFTREPVQFIKDPIYPAVNVVSPTWHSINKDTYEYTDWSLEEYLNYYEENNVEVWGAFSNSFDPVLTSNILNDSKIRSNVIEQIITISKKNRYKGINLDYENVYFEDKDKFSVFIRELYIRARQENIKVSVDITIISNSPTWSMFYDRKVIGRYSDYVVLMAYDERTKPEQGIGSIASLPWVEKGISELIDYTRENKIILGVPFYTRLWETIDDNGKVTYDSTAFKLTTADEFIKNNNFKIRYDEAAGQNYGEAFIDNVFYQIWIEDEVSLKNRLELVAKYGVNGIAVWTLNYSKQSMWMIVEEMLVRE